MEACTPKQLFKLIERANRMIMRDGDSWFTPLGQRVFFVQRECCKEPGRVCIYDPRCDNFHSRVDDNEEAISDYIRKTASWLGYELVEEK